VKRLKNIFDLVDKYFVAVLTVTIGLAIFYHHFERPNLKTPDKLLYIEGQVDQYSFQRKPGYRATLKQYYIWLDNYPCTFQIKADFLSFFNQTQFENEVKKGDKLKLTIPKEIKDQLSERGTHIFILSASKNSTNYLSLADTIPKENNNFDIYAGLFFIVGGIVYYILKSRAIIK
jgi:hypothetical protein